MLPLVGKLTMTIPVSCLSDPGETNFGRLPVCRKCNRKIQQYAMLDLRLGRCHSKMGLI